MRPFAIDPESWETLNHLLDSALDLPEAERLAFVDGLPPEYESFKPRLRDLLSRVQTESVLGTLPKLAPSTTDGVTDTSRRTETAGDVVGLYRLVREIGEGGMGTVWLAERTDGMVNRQVALKLPHGSFRREHLAERMVREREILAGLDHPNIARLYDAGLTPGGDPFLALEYVEGRAIEQYCDEHRLDTRARLVLFLQVVHAVAHAHEKLVIHRDLKPSNVLVTDGGDVKLLDFGIARILDEGQEARETAITQLAGPVLTPQYASPEQIRGESIGVTSDVYSLGVVLYELLTGALPYEVRGGARREIEDAILESEPARPSEVARDPARQRALRGDVDTIVLRALEKSKAKRYATANALAEDIERHLDGRPVLARPDGAWYRAVKLARRNRLAVGAAGAVLFAIVAGAAVAIHQARIAVAEQRRADEVKDFIAAIFRDANLEEGEGRSLGAVDVLDRAHDRFETDLRTDPAVRVELASILGSSFMSLGETAKAETVIEEAVEESRRSLDPQDPLAVRAELLRSWVLMYRGKTAEAREGLDEFFEALERNPTLTDEDLVLAWRVRCGLEIDAGNREAAVAAGEEAVRVAERTLPDEHPEKLQAMLELAYAYHQSGREDAALELAERAYRLAAETHPDNPLHPNVIKARARYGNDLGGVGRLDEGIAELEQSVRDASEVFGPSSMTVGVYLQNLVTYQLQAGRVAEALETSARALEICEKYFERDSLTRISSAEARGGALMMARRISESLAPYEDAYRSATRALGSADRFTLQIRLRRALALAHNGASDEARREIAAVMEEATRSGAVSVYSPIGALGRVERLEGNFAAALELQERALALRSEDRGFGRALTQLEIGMLYVELGRYEEAMAPLEDASERFSTDGRMDPDDAEVLIGLGRARLGQDRASEALPYLEEAYAFWRELDPDNRWAGEASLWLSDAYAALGRGKDASAARARAVEILSRSPVPADARLLRRARLPATF